ncbi:hypothetical protein HK100_006245 [Physocladia obscura]|uniref:Bromo domain-containing protein n=1 Tax=Physocladia obscura TaxID=109957 RepID=A0AAD5SQP9_9FUNG|nr:hypothetical protein HK100_006245 [Physocladia obscura]
MYFSEQYVFDIFFELPDKKLYRDYYLSIKNPIALDIILTKIDTLNYKSTQEFAADIRLMVKNAKTYNVEGSQVYINAELLEVFFENTVKKYVTDNVVVLPSITNSSNSVSNASKSEGKSIVEGETLESITVNGEIYHPGTKFKISSRKKY